MPSSLPEPRVVAAFAAIYLVWGSTFLAIAGAVETIPPFPMMAARCLVGGGILLGLARLREPDSAWPAPAEWLGSGAVGIFLFVGCHAVLAREEQFVPSGVSALCLATIPLFVPLLAWGFLGSGRPSSRTAMALFAAFLGVALLVAGKISGGGLSATDAVLLLLAAFSWAAGAGRPPVGGPPDRRPQGSAAGIADGGSGCAAAGGRAGACGRLVRIRRGAGSAAVADQRPLARRPALSGAARHGGHLHRLHLAARPRRADTGGNVRVREPGGGGVPRLGACGRAAHGNHSGRDGGDRGGRSGRRV